MGDKGIQPAFISIKNSGPVAYYFRKNLSGRNFIPSELTFIKCAGKHSWDRFIPKFFRKANSAAKRKFLSREIADDFIYPKEVKSGIMFLASLKSTEPFLVTLINRETGEKLIFEFHLKEGGGNAGRN